ncbi:hypothetical protein [Paenibacillus azoreducens]|uniref:Glycosyltransferase n=1 Tax=Paenibacillus azoreducens TaxID=116718 RepID=A0A919YER0_9BACL|nr:hypothetical protein [Paenibacillus azoreducens]GIO49109.1 hypothetical protein J34TS1_38740 [Paenibacillus azoreducens]
MKESVIIVSDYIEGEPVVASVRFAGLMEYFRQRFELIVIHDGKYGTKPSRFASASFEYTTADSMLTQPMRGGRTHEKSGAFRRYAENMLRKKWILSAWRNYKYSKFKFDRMNASLYAELDRLLLETEVKAVFVTVPDVYGLYVLDYIKRKSPHLPSIIEIRDIINHSIGEGNPKYVLKQAEQMVPKLADGVIAVSEGIHQHYRIRNPVLEMELVKNGYDEECFEGAVFQPVSLAKGRMILAHIGSIYKGRNVKALIEGLQIFSERKGIDVELHIAGLLDRQAISDMDSAADAESGVTLHIHGSLEHEQAVRLLREADAAVILTHTHGSDYAIPGKTFEYIGACKPILAVTEDRELSALVQGRYGECAGHEANGIAQALERLSGATYDFSNRREYSRKFQAERILQFMEQIMLDGRNVKSE